MPKFNFVCNNCKNEESKFVPLSRKELPCSLCQSTMLRQMPTLLNTEVTEVVDPLTNRKHKQEQKDLMQERRDEYFWTVEVPRLVQEMSLETCLEQGWMWIDDDGKLHVHNKPPHKR